MGLFVTMLFEGVMAMIRIHLAELLGRKHWKQAKLAKVTGIRPTTISEMCREIIVRVTLDDFDLICEALDCRLDELITREPDVIPRIERNQNGDPIRPAR